MSEEFNIYVLKIEVEMLDNMVAEVEGQFEQVRQNLEKIRAVRAALKHVIDTHEQPQFDFGAEE